MIGKNSSFKCHKISEGKTSGEVLFSKDGICFYLIDPESGVVIERNHSLFGKSIANKILVFPNGTGSSVVQADGMYQLKMHNMGPKAMIVENADTTLVASSIIMEIPLVDKVDSNFNEIVKNKDILEVNATEGEIKLVQKGE